MNCTYFLDDLLEAGLDGGVDCAGFAGGLRSGFLGPAALTTSLRLVVLVVHLVSI